MRPKPELRFTKLDEHTGTLLDRMFEKKDCMIEINPGRVILPADYMTIGQDILDMEVRESDVWMCSYPRTGSTWAQEMVWLIGHDLDYEGAKSLQQTFRRSMRSTSSADQVRAQFLRAEFHLDHGHDRTAWKQYIQHEIFIDNNFQDIANKFTHIFRLINCYVAVMQHSYEEATQLGHFLDYLVQTWKKVAHSKMLPDCIRCPLVELSCIMVDGHAEWHDESVKGTSVDLVKYRLPTPRYIRSHLPWDLLPLEINNEDGSAKAKVIYTARNPKDMVVSYYHYCKLVHGLKGTFEEFCDIFMRDRAPFGPVWNHILGFWNRRHDPNLLFIKFEEMKHNLPTVVRRTAKFLNKTMSDEEVDKLCDHLSFNNMKTNRAVNLEAILEKSFGTSYLEATNLRFIRKGEIGDWKNYMSDDLSRRFDHWSEQHLKGTELSFE